MIYGSSIIARSVTTARLAQSVEHETLNLRVVGSSPTLGENIFEDFFLISQSVFYYVVKYVMDFTYDKYIYNITEQLNRNGLIQNLHKKFERHVRISPASSVGRAWDS